MKARLMSTALRSGPVARNFLRMVQGRRSPLRQREKQATDAARVLEDYREPHDPLDEDHPIDPDDLIAVLDRGLDEFGVIPYYFSAKAKQARQEITIGSRVTIIGDAQRRPFIVVKIDAEDQSVRIQDTEHFGYVLPWDLVVPWERD